MSLTNEQRLEDRKYRDWEYIAHDTWRLKVLGGWLVRYAMSNNMVFLADTEHKWEWIQILGTDQLALREKLV